MQGIVYAEALAERDGDATTFMIESAPGVDIRKKLFSAGVLVETDEYEKHVSHKPARLYQLNKSLFSKKNIVNFSTFARIINI